MTSTKDLRTKFLAIEKIGYGNWRITVKFRNKTRQFTTNDSQSIDDIKSEDGERRGRYLRERIGLRKLWQEFKRKTK